MLDKESYRKSWDWKLEWYRQTGYSSARTFHHRGRASGGLDQGELTRVAHDIEALL